KYLMQQAQSLGIKVITLVLSWDNTTTKGLPGCNPDLVVAWTEQMEKELTNHNDVDVNNVHVGGVVKYDKYFYDIGIENGKNFRERYSLRRGTKVIFYCLESPTAYRWNIEMIRIVAEIIEASLNEFDIKLIVRPHPILYRVEDSKLIYQKEIDELNNLEKEFSAILFDHPDVYDSNLSFYLHKTEQEKLSLLLKNVDVVLCFYSSITIEAAIFDTPVINLNLFEKNEIPNYYMSRHTHNQRLGFTGGLRHAYTEADLCKLIRMYLLNPAIDREGRSLIVKNETGPNRGRAGASTSKTLEDYLERNRLNE
ncbi:CDP-glycerol glycerophosphotransferase family protein, partial [Gammaproteobacteria bacterium]|nr:CDP-glycerol glycerophosphotransferase family protein [Gammaproteobacteria bacterium]